MTTTTVDPVQNHDPLLKVSTEFRVGRRRFTADYKQRILAEAASCQRGDLGLMLRREGIYSATLNAWRKQSQSGDGCGIQASKRGRKPSRTEALKPANDRLKRENTRLVERLRQAELIIDVQKKLSAMLGLTPAQEGP